MAVSRKLTVKRKRMLGLIVAIIFLLYLLRRFYPQGIDQIANAVRVSPQQFDAVTDNLSQVGEGWVLYSLVRSMLARGWVKTLAMAGTLVYAIDGALLLFGVNISDQFKRGNNNSGGTGGGGM
jgi:hypothetical protein